MRIFFASDVHGSETCFRKLVNAGAFYGVDYLIMGGDLAGKELVPVVRSGPGAASGWRATFRGGSFALETDAEAAEFERRVATVGAYTLRTDEEFVRQLRDDQELVEETLHRLVLDRTEQWVALAAERLRGSGRRLLIGLGNDDYDDMVPYLDQDGLDCVGYAHDGLLELDGGFTLASLGWSNVTPWRTHRELTEVELEERLTELEASTDPARTIFNVHVPPYGSGLDEAPRLGDDLRVQLVGGQPDLVPVGSTAVARGIAAYQPLLSLHGHIHEGRGVVKTGRTTVVNPGSEYDQASLLGALLEVKPGKVKRCQLVTG
ncbi:metallophosphoesterase [Spongisporangium articulatum]|uniref:Metallophosphoesterase n=1 Tax=Spongisporangium articulatum TaxID=3362603 RepID=A0ABW8AR44_9ACTN